MAGHHFSAIRRNGKTEYRLIMKRQQFDEFPGIRVPEAEGLVYTAREEVFPIRAQGNGQYWS